MRTRSLTVAVIILAMSVRSGVAQDFGTTRWVGVSPSAWQSPTLQPDWRYVDRAAYRGEYNTACRPATYAAQPTAYRIPPVAASGYAPIAYSQGLGNGYSTPVVVGQAPTYFDPYRVAANPTFPIRPPFPSASGPYGYGNAAVPQTAQMPRGYYRADGFYGQDTVFAQGQPIRNFFRKLLP